MPEHTRNTNIALVIVLAVTAAVYLPSLRNGFTNWDDDIYVTGNAAVKDVSLRGAIRLFTGFHVSNYHPLTMLSLMADGALGGGGPFAYHLHSLGLHLLNILLVFVLFSRMHGRGIAPLAVAALFALHPIHTEPVAWISSRKDLLYSAFYLVSMTAYVNYVKYGRKKYYFASLGLFVLSLLSKPMAVTLPAVLFLLDYLSGKKLNMRSLKEKAPFFAAAAVFALLTVLAQQESASIREQNSLLFNILTAMHGLLFYAAKTVLPVNLAPLYEYPADTVGALPSVFILSPFITAAAAWCVIRMVRKGMKKPAFGILFYGLSLLPVLQILPAGRAYAADRYAYLPVMGLMYAAACGLESFSGKGKKQAYVSYTVLILAVSAFTALVPAQSAIWKNGVTLWTDTVRKYPDSPTPYVNRGIMLSRQGDYDGAVSDYSRALELRPDFVKAYSNRGNAYLGRNDTAAALADFDRAIEISPGMAALYINRAVTYHRMSRYGDAIADFTRAIELDSSYRQAYSGRADSYLASGQPQLAVLDNSILIRKTPGDPQPYFNRALAHAAMGMDTRALDDYNTAVRLRPGYLDAYLNRGNLYQKTGEYEKAAGDYGLIIEADRTYIRAYENLAAAYTEMERYSDALSILNDAFGISGGSRALFINRGIVHVHMKEYGNAVKDFTDAIKIDPGNPDAYHNRAYVYRLMGKGGLAEKDAARSKELGGD